MKLNLDILNKIMEYSFNETDTWKPIFKEKKGNIIIFFIFNKKSNLSKIISKSILKKFNYFNKKITDYEIYKNNFDLYFSFDDIIFNRFYLKDMDEINKMVDFLIVYNLI
jgi:hypothetical protein